MQRMELQEMMEHAIFSMKAEELYCDDLRTMAFCLYIMTGETNERLLTEFGLLKEDVDVYFESKADSQDEADMVQIQDNQAYQEAIKQAESKQPAQSSIITDTSQAAMNQSQVKTKLRLPRNNYTHSTPLVPMEGERRVNRFVDDGTVHADDKNLDRQIIRPKYEFDRRGPSSVIIDKECRSCRRDFSVDEAEFINLSGEHGLFNKGFICPSCAKDAIVR